MLRWEGHEKWPKTAFFAKVPSPRHFCEEIFSGVVPSERARTQLSEYVGHIGVLMIKTIVIPAQSQDRVAKVGSSQKIVDVTKNLPHAQKNFLHPPERSF